jgi:hypothetical protein
MNSRKMNRSVGPKPSKRLCHQGDPVSSGWALTTTRLSCRSRDRASLSAKAGISVRKRVVGFVLPNRTFCLNVPWIAVPFEVISLTWPSLTCWRKKGV